MSATREPETRAAPGVVVDPGTRIVRYVPDINVLRINCEQLVMTATGHWQTWAARQLYALGCAPKLLTAAKYDDATGSGAWLNPHCEIELRIDAARPPDAADRACVFADGARFEDVRDACQAAWLAHNADLITVIAARYGLYWEARFDPEKLMKAHEGLRKYANRT